MPTIKLSDDSEVEFTDIEEPKDDDKSDDKDNDKVVDDEVVDTDTDVGDEDEIDYEKDFGCSQEEYEEAVAQGWNPEYTGPNARSAKEFIERGSFFRKIESQNKTIKQLQESQKFLMERAEQADKVARENLRAELKRAKKEAIKEGDGDLVVEIDEQLDKIKEEEKEAKTKPKAEFDDQDSISPVYENWLEQNRWYATNQRLHKAADALAKSYTETNGEPQNPEELLEVLDFITKQVQITYKDEFVNKNKSKPSPVDGDTKQTRKRSSAGDKFSVKDLDPEEVLVMNNMIEKTGIKPQEYVNQLTQAGYFKNR